MRKKFLLMTFLTLLFTAMGTSVLRAQDLYVSCDYNSSTEGWGTTRFSNYAGAYAYATANATNATIVVEKTNTLSGNTFDDNHENYSRLAVVIKDGATMGNALSKWDMTYPVTVEPGGTLTCARPASASVSNIHIKNTLTVGAEGSEKEAHVDFLSDAYQDCDISIRYNGKINVYNSVFRVQDLDAQGTLTIKDSEVYVDGAFASATSTLYPTTLTNSTITINGNLISGGLSDFAGGTSNQLGNVKLNNSTLTIEEGDTKVATAKYFGATMTATGSTIDVNNLTIADGATLNLNDGSTLEAENITAEGTGSVKIDGVQLPVVDGDIVLPQGNDFTGYTGTDGIWGEVWGNATTSFVIKVLDADGEVMGTTSLNNIGGIIDGDVNVTWNIKLDADSNTDQYWAMEWTTAPTIDNMPAKVELWVDGFKVSGGNVVLNGPDNLNMIYAAVTDADGKILSYHTSIAAAVAAIPNTRSNTQGYIALLRDTDEAITLPAGIVLNTNGFNADNIVIPVASVNGTSYATLADALLAASAMTGDVTVEIYKKVTLNLPLAGNYSSIKFLAKDTDAEIYLDVQGYITATGKEVAFEGLTLSKSQGGYITNAGFMNVAFGVYDVTKVTYTNCTFANGAYASSGNVTYTGCTFKRSHDKYGLWAYGDVDVTVNGCTFDDYRGIKMYAEGAAKTVDLTVKNTDFSAVNDKPAIVLTYGESVTLENNTYSSTGVFELDLDGAPNGTPINYTDDNDEKLTCKNDNGACGVLCDGKIYTTVAQAAEVATSGSTVTLLHDSAETVVLPIGVILDKNGHNADGVTVAEPIAKIGEEGYTSLQEAIDAVQNGETIELLSDVTENVTLTEATGLYYTINGSDKTMNGKITVTSLSDTNDNRRITISNINFVEETDDNVDFISSVETNHYPRLTVEGCTFTGSGNNGDVAIRLKSSHSVVIEHCTGTGLHSFLQNTSGWNLTINNVTVSESKSGLALGTVQGVTVKGSNIDVNGYGIRLDAQYDNNAVIESNVVEAFIPVVVRKAEVVSSITFSGTNTMTASNTDGLWCAIGTSEYETNGTMPTAPTGQVTVTLNDTGLSMDGVYGNYYKFSGEGTAENPYLINNLYELKYFRDDVNEDNTYAGKYIKLTADIDLNNEEWTPIGNDTNKFQGYFDGNEKTISNLKVTGNTRYKGFFGYIKGTGMSATTTPSVKDLTLDGVNVNVEGDGYYVGGLAGQAYTCNITNVTVKGNVSGVRYVGGLVGHVYTYFKDCHFIGNASCSFDALGGIAGAGDCRAYDCSVIGDITGSNWVGGIVGNGQEGTSAVGCYVKGNVKTSNNYYRGVGGIAGVAGHGYSSSEFKNNYFDGEVYLEDVKVPAMIMGLVNANNNASIKATVEGNSWNTDYYDVNTLVYVVAEISSSDASLEDWIAGTSEELTKPRNNNLIMLESDLQYVTEEDYVIMSFSEVTEEQVEQALINNAVAKIGETTYTTLQKALDAAVAGTGNVTVEIIKDIDLTNVDWNPVTVSAPNYPVVTVNGNNKTITGLNDMLFAGTWAGGSGLIINDLTIANSNIVHDVDDSAGNIGVGAFIGYPEASATITLNDCHLKNSTVNGGHWTGGLIGMAGGYNGNDGPVFMNLTIEGCSVTGSTITGKGSCGGIIGHGSCAAWTAVNIQNTTVSDNYVISTGSSTNKAGAIMGTIGAAGQPTTANGVTLTGGATVSATVADNTVTSGGTTITTIYGRQGTPTGMLELAGGTYDNYPIEEDVAYAKPAAGFMIKENADGTYGLVPDPAYGKVAMIGETYYETLQEAVTVGGEVKVIANITLDQIVTVAVDKTVVLDLNGKTISTSAEETSYAINNLGTLTLKDSSEGKTGAVNARGIYNGYDENGNHVASAKIIVESGTYNAKGTNGGAAIFNYGIAEINGGTFTSIGGYSLSNQTGSSITVADGVTANNGIYISNGVLTINGGDIDGDRSGCHVVYAWNSTVTINGGDFYNNNSGNATIMAAGTTQMTIKGGIFGIKDGRVPGNANTWTSCLTDTQNTATMIVIGGTFNGGFRVQNGTTMTIEGGSFNDCFGSGYNIYGTATVKGGTFTDNAAITFARNYLADGFKLEENADGTYGVVPFVEKSYEIKENTTLADAIAQAKEDGAEIVTYIIYGAATLETGFSHGIVDFGGEEGYITIKGANVNTRSEDSFTITGGGVPDIKGVTFKDLTFYDEGTYLPTANEFMYQNFIDCTFENVKFEDGIRLSGNCTIKDCEVNANTTNEYAIWLDEGEFEITGTDVEAGNDAYGMIKSDNADKITITDNTFTYLGKVNKEALNTNGATIIADGNTFIDCAKGIVPADKVNYTADGTTQITDAIIAVDNEIIIYVAKIGDVKYQSLAEAATAATTGQTIQLLWAEGKDPIAMAATFVGNKTVTITGTADVDWSKGWFFVGRGGEGDGHVIFDNANLTSVSNSTANGFNVSGSKVSDNTTNNGTVEIKNSTIVLDYMLNKNVITLDNSTLTVKNGFSVTGRKASESATGEDATATMTLSNNSKVVVNNMNGMGIGHEAYGIMNIDATSTFETTQNFNISAKGTMNVNGGNVKTVGTLTNNGAVNVTGNASMNVNTLTGNAINFTNVTIANANIGGAVNAFGTNNFTGETTIGGILSVGYNGSPAEQVVVNITGNFNGGNVLIGSSNDNVLNVGNAEGTETTAHFGQLGAFGDVNIVNADVTYGYTFIRNDFNVTNSTMAINGGTNTYFSGNAKVVIDNSSWNLSGSANIGSYGGPGYKGNADVTLKNGSSMTAINLGVEQYDGTTVILTLEDSSTLTATNLSNTGSIVLAGEQAKITSNELTGTNNVPTTNIEEYKVVYENGVYKVVEKVYVAQIGENKYETLQEAVDAVEDGGTITLIANETFTENNRYYNSGWWDGLVYSGDKSFTIDLAGFTISQDGALNDYLMWFKNDGTKDNTITLKNGTLDAGTSAYSALATSSSNTNKITINTENINFIGENSNGAVLKIRDGAELNVKVGTVITGTDSYVGIECYGATVNIYDGAEIYQNDSTSYNGCLVGVSGNGTVNVYGGYGKGVSGGFIAMTSGGTINVAGGEWIANTDGSYANSNKSVLVAQSNKQYNAGAGNSIVNVTGGTFKGGYNCYGDAAGDAQINISGGNFNADPSAYVVDDDYEVVPKNDGTYDVIQVSGTQTRDLQAGWNWFSSYVDLSQEGGLLKLQTALGESGLAIKGQTENQSVQYVKIGVVEGEEIYAWTGNQNWNPYSNKMYMIKTSKAMSAEEFGINGDFIDYEHTTIALFQGWNWISYPLNEPALINEALAKLNPTEGDQIKFRGNTYAEYFNGEWYPEDFVFMPGEGYMYKAESPNSFVYTKGTTNVRATNKTDENNNWMAQTSEYANNMTITAMLSIDGEVVNDNYEIAAFANGECRGSARPIYIEKFDAYILFMTVYGEEVEDLTFRYYDVNYGTEYELDNRVVYSNDASLGSIKDPYMFTLNITGVDETSMSEINIYPNPTTTDREINLQATCDKVEVFNALGVKVAEYHNVDTLDALETAGIYVIRITNDNAVKHCRLVVK